MARDYTTLEGAELLAMRLKEYWRAQGVDIETTVELVQGSPKHAPGGWQVRSDLKLKPLKSNGAGSTDA